MGIEWRKQKISTLILDSAALYVWLLGSVLDKGLLWFNGGVAGASIDGFVELEVTSLQR